MQRQKVLKLNMQQVYENQLDKLDKELSDLKKQQQGIESPVTVDEVLQKLFENRQFRQSVRLPPSDSGQSVYAKVTYVEEQMSDRQNIHFVIPGDHDAEAEEYKKHLQKVYGEVGIPEISFTDLPKFREHLVLAKIEGMWCRSRILNFLPEMLTVSVEDIDSGVKAIQTVPPGVFKMPKTEEMTKQAFASKVIVDNMASNEEITPGNFIKIRMTHLDPFGVNFAEADEEEVSEEQSQDLELTSHLEETLRLCSPAKLIKSAEVIPVPSSSPFRVATPPVKLIESAEVIPERSKEASPPVNSGHQKFDPTCDWNESELPAGTKEATPPVNSGHQKFDPTCDWNESELPAGTKEATPPVNSGHQKFDQSCDWNERELPAGTKEATPPVNSGHQKFDPTCDLGESELPAVKSQKPVATGAPARPFGLKRNHRHISQVKFSKMFTMSYIEMNELSYGLNLYLFFVCGSEINQGRLDVSAVPVENWVFLNDYDFKQMENDIAAYVERQPNEAFKPAIDELCLAKFKDGRFHRAVCTNVKLSQATMKFIDYGVIDNVDFADLVKFSLQFVHPCFVHTVDFTLASGRAVSKIDASRTQCLLLKNPNISAQIMNNPDMPGKYKIVLDDKFVAF